MKIVQCVTLIASLHITLFHYTISPPPRLRLVVSPSILLLIATNPCKYSHPTNVLYIIPSTDRLIPLATHAPYSTIHNTCNTQTIHYEIQLLIHNLSLNNTLPKKSSIQKLYTRNHGLNTDLCKGGS